MENRKRKTLQELTFKDSFMFAAVMMDEENARGVLERALDMKIAKVEVSYEKSIVYNPEYKGVRLDVYIRDDKGSHFNVEMQVANKKVLKRARYYHSQIDMELLLAGIEYEMLPDTYVIFICDYDPIGLKKYKYTMHRTIVEDDTYEYRDGSHTVFLSTVGKNDDEVSKELVKFLKYAGAELEDSQNDYADEFVRRLQKSVNRIKTDREMGRRHMIFEEMMKEEYSAGKADGLTEGLAKGLAKGREEAFALSIINFLTDIAPVSDDLKNRISSIEDLDALTALNKKAARTKSIEEFEKQLTEMKY